MRQAVPTGVLRQGVLQFLDNKAKTSNVRFAHSTLGGIAVTFFYFFKICLMFNLRLYLFSLMTNRSLRIGGNKLAWNL